jgi:hypothetical protein
LLQLRNLILLRLNNPLVLDNDRLCQFLLRSSVHLRGPHRNLRVMCDVIFVYLELEVVGFNSKPVA